MNLTDDYKFPLSEIEMMSKGRREEITEINLYIPILDSMLEQIRKNAEIEADQLAKIENAFYNGYATQDGTWNPDVGDIVKKVYNGEILKDEEKTKIPQTSIEAYGQCMQYSQKITAVQNRAVSHQRGLSQSEVRWIEGTRKKMLEIFENLYKLEYERYTKNRLYNIDCILKRNVLRIDKEDLERKVKELLDNSSLTYYEICVTSSEQSRITSWCRSRLAAMLMIREIESKPKLPQIRAERNRLQRTYVQELNRYIQTSPITNFEYMNQLLQYFPNLKHIKIPKGRYFESESQILTLDLITELPSLKWVYPKIPEANMVAKACYYFPKMFDIVNITSYIPSFLNVPKFYEWTRQRLDNPVLQGDFNLSEECKFLLLPNSLQITPVGLLKYHKVGVDRAKRLAEKSNGFIALGYKNFKLVIESIAQIFTPEVGEIYTLLSSSISFLSPDSQRLYWEVVKEFSIPSPETSTSSSSSSSSTAAASAEPTQVVATTPATETSISSSSSSSSTAAASAEPTQAVATIQAAETSTSSSSSSSSTPAASAEPTQVVAVTPATETSISSSSSSSSTPAASAEPTQAVATTPAAETSTSSSSSSSSTAAESTEPTQVVATTPATETSISSSSSSSSTPAASAEPTQVVAVTPATETSISSSSTATPVNNLPQVEDIAEISPIEREDKEEDSLDPVFLDDEADQMSTPA